MPSSFKRHNPVSRQRSKNLASFIASVKAHPPANPLQGVIVVNISSKEMSAGIDNSDVPQGINVRGTLVFNFAAAGGHAD